LILPLVLACLVLFYSLVAARLERTVVTAPLLFACAGALAWAVLPGLGEPAMERDMMLVAAELGLVLLLFTDASRTDLAVLRHIRALPVRLLTIGMLATIVLGALAALALFPSLTVWEAGILAAILAPTDAGLGQVIVNSERVPLRIRQGINVEAGLNDGLSVPFLLFFMALAGVAAGSDEASLVRYLWEQLGLGVLAGAGIGLVGGALLERADLSRFMADGTRRLAVVALPLIALLLSDEMGASMFIAAFVAGLAVQVRYREAGKHSVEFTEEWGQLINLSVFFIFGLMCARSWQQFEWVHAAYAVLSLTLVRMVPVALSLLGTRLSTASVLFMGWFGPRGLASIVLGLVFLEEQIHASGESTIRLVVMATVALSIVLHGVSALPGMKLYAAHVGRLPPDAPERIT
jgi:NhaP-type Na+/H+ or K+/H+ antiporter